MPEQIFTDGLPQTDKTDIIAAGPIAKLAGQQALRVVLRYSSNQFIVHDQVFPHYVNGKTEKDFSESSFGQGNYYPADQAIYAAKQFAIRVARQASGYADIDTSAIQFDHDQEMPDPEDALSHVYN